jgi:hypothetical protein
MKIVQQILDISGIGRERMQLRWVSAAEGQLFAEYVKELTEIISDLGPLDLDQIRLPLAAVGGALESPRMRWLLGMDRKLTERENVYHEKLDEKTYEQLLSLAAVEEYQKALLVEVLKEGPQSVKEMASKTGLGVYDVSLRLNDLERTGLAELQGYEGRTPKFIGPAA